MYRHGARLLIQALAPLSCSKDEDIWAGLVARKHMQLPTADAWLKMVASADINTRTQRVRHRSYL